MDKLISQLIDISCEAGRQILDCYNKKLDVHHKADNTYLTNADLGAHRLIFSALKDLTPNVPILSEESEQIPPYHIRSSWQNYWLIDPLDGTKDFIEKTGNFCVNIAYIENNRPSLGLIYVPITETHFYARAHLGAFKTHKARTQSIQTKKNHKPLRVVIGRHSDKDKSLTHHLKKLETHQITEMGSALKFAYIAEGIYDYYPRFGPCSEWDTAAGVCILEAAGGKVFDINKKQMSYNKSETLLSPSFFAYCR